MSWRRKRPPSEPGHDEVSEPAPSRASRGRRRPSERDFAAAVRVRDGSRRTWSTRGARLGSAVPGVYVLNALMLRVSMRAVGRGVDDLPVGSVLVIRSFVRLLTIVSFTPGGVGVTEVLYVPAFLLVAPGANESQEIAGVVLVGGVTYAGPIVLGVVGPAGLAPARFVAEDPPRRAGRRRRGRGRARRPRASLDPESPG